MPFIDLLLSCVLFLLMTAMWNRLAAVEAPLDDARDPTALVARDESSTLLVHVGANAFELATLVGDRVEVPRDAGLASLRAALRERRSITSSDARLELIVDDSVAYEHVIATMDAAVGCGFLHVGVRDRV